LIAWRGVRLSIYWHLAWKYVQVWDAALGDIATTLNFDTSSLDLTSPDGQRLSVGGYQGVKI